MPSFGRGLNVYLRRLRRHKSVLSLCIWRFFVVLCWFRGSPNNGDGGQYLEEFLIDCLHIRIYSAVYFYLFIRPPPVRGWQNTIKQ
jgi:hypothetical protein